MGPVIPACEASARGSALMASSVRHAGRDALDAALQSGREQLLALFEGFERALGRDGLHIACDPVLNLPLWELGHIGWFEEYWLSRNPDRRRGIACPADVRRSASIFREADRLYDSSQVPHARRWALGLPGADETRAYLCAVRDSTRALLRQSADNDNDNDTDSDRDSDSDLYFFRLVLLHEDMHREAWHVMAQHLGIDLGPAMTGRAATPSRVHGEWQCPGGMHSLGLREDGFVFDNELEAHPVRVAGFSIDRAPVSWRRYLPFLEAGGYASPRWWSAPGWTWRMRELGNHPRHLRPAERGWQQQRFAEWVSVDLDTPALHLSAHEAQAWCRWSGRRLPTEVEWETAALQAVEQNEPFEWGDVWEWTASAFMPYAGFTPHPYRDYSLPWFDGRPVLRGGSFATTAHMKHPRYRNFFTADRNDVFAGFRSCALMPSSTARQP